MKKNLCRWRVISFSSAMVLLALSSSAVAAGEFSSQEVLYDESSAIQAVKDRFAYCKSEIMNSSSMTIHDVMEQKARMDQPCTRSETPAQVKIENMRPFSYILNNVAFVQMIYKVSASVDCDGDSTKEDYYLLVSSYLPASDIACTYQNIK